MSWKERVASWWFRPLNQEQECLTRLEEITSSVFANVQAERREREMLSARLTLIEVGLKNMARQ